MNSSHSISAWHYPNHAALDQTSPGGGGNVCRSGGSGSLVPDGERVTTRDIEPRAVFRLLVANDDVHLGVAFDKARDVSAWLTDYFNARETF